MDSTKYYVDVVINFHGTDYDKYTVNVYRDEEKCLLTRSSGL